MCYRPRLLILLLAVSSSTVSGREQIPPTLESVRAQINARDASIRSLKYRVTIEDQARRGLLRGAAFMSKTEVVEVLTDYSLGHSPNSRAKIDVTATLPEGAPGPKTPGVQRWTHCLSNVASKDARMLERALQGDALVGVILKQSALIWTTSPDEFLGLAYWSPANILFRDRIRAKVQGLDRIDGREVVRLAWEFEPNLNLSIGDHRGECWVAPDLGYALVRSTASSRGGPETPWKETARVDASEFRRVDKGGSPGNPISLITSTTTTLRLNSPRRPMPPSRIGL